MIIVVLLGFAYIAWPWAWLYVFFVKGYVLTTYPGSKRGVDVFDPEEQKKVEKEGRDWMFTSAAAILLWLVVSPFLR